jgi:hypothetical protein
MRNSTTTERVAFAISISSREGRGGLPGRLAPPLITRQRGAVFQLVGFDDRQPVPPFGAVHFGRLQPALGNQVEHVARDAVLLAGKNFFRSGMMRRVG